MYEFNVNCILILQSLGAEDRKTGDELQSEIQIALPKGREGMCSLFNIETKDDLFSYLLSMKQQAIDDGLKPWIHFEMHGSKEGLELTRKVNGIEETETVLWTDIKEIIREINIATKNNLFVSLATCHGGYLLTMYSYCDPCPFFGYMGMTETVGERDVLYSYTAFFQAMLRGADLVTSVKAMKQEVPEIVDNIAYINCFQYYRMILGENAKMMKDERELADWKKKIYLDLKTRFPKVPDDYIKKTIDRGFNEGIYDQLFLKCQNVFLHNQLERFDKS